MVQRRVKGTSRVFSKGGSEIVQTFKTVVDKHGAYKRVPDTQKNLYAEIQASARGCDVNYLVARYAAGETDVLSKVQGAYGDFTAVPATYADLLNNVLAGERLFNSLPVGVKEKFGNDVSRFIQSAGSPEWFSLMGIGQKDSEKIRASSGAKKVDEEEGGEA